MKTKTADLTGPALDWAVAKCEGDDEEVFRLFYNPSEPSDYDVHGYPEFHYSTDWSQGGPLLERECLDVRVFAEHGSPDGGPYWISERHPAVGHGPTPLVAAMRCYVTTKLGDEVDVPDELV